MKKLGDVAHEKLINIKGRHGVLDKFMDVGHTLEMAIFVENQLTIAIVRDCKTQWKKIRLRNILDSRQILILRKVFKMVTI